MELDVTPHQPARVVEALAVLLAESEPRPAPDPWWQAGIDEALEG